MIPLKDDIPSRTFPGVTVLLIALNVVIFLADLSVGGALSRVFALRPAWVAHTPTAILDSTGLPVWVTLFTMMFLHGGWLHIGGNMLYLWIFGNNVEDKVGHAPYLIFYLVCGLAAEGLQIAMGPNSMVPTLGASGAIAGVLGAYYYLFPGAQVTTVVTLFIIWPIIVIPARLVLGFWFILNLINTFVLASATLHHTSTQSGGVAFAAHVGGFVTGLLLIRLLASRDQDRSPDYRRPRFFDENWR